MATDVERLVVSLEASITKYERAMNKALGQTNNTARRIESRFAAMSNRVNSGFTGLQRGIAAAFASVAALRGAQQLIDASTRIENSLKVAGLAGEELKRVYDGLYQSAQRNAAPLESLTTLFGRAAIVQKELGVSTQELLGFTDNVALALRVAGTDAQSASGALLQLSQALGSGTVRAEEFNSILEGALPIAQAAAAGLAEAGGSVAKLRALVGDGKVSSEAFFRAFEAGSVILREKVASSELTVSQSFIRLQNVLIDTAGKFDNATLASQRIAGFLDSLATSIQGVGAAADQNAPAINRFLDWVGKIGSGLGDQMFAGTVREFDMIGAAVDEVASRLDRYGSSVTDAELRTAAAEQALVNFSINGASRFGDLQPVVEDFIQQLLEGRGTAESAAEAISAIGQAGDFGTLIDDLSGLVMSLFEVRSEAVATAAAVAAAARGDTAGTNIAGQRAEQLGNRPKPTASVKPVSLSDYAPPGSAGGGGGGGGRSSPDRFAQALASQQQRIDALNRETELQRKLGIAVNDYGFALERLRAQIELENAAKEAGLPLDEKRRQQIDELASSYGLAMSEAERLAEAQGKVRESAEKMGQAGRQALDTLIDGFLEGKDAGDIFRNVLADIGRSLLNMGINGLGVAFKIPGFAKGTNSAPGGLARINEQGGEIVNLPRGAQVIPHDISMQMARAAGNSAAGPNITFAPTIDARGADVAAVVRLEGVMQKQAAEFEGRVKHIVKTRGTKWR